MHACPYVSIHLPIHARCLYDCRAGTPASALLTPPDAVGDVAAELTAAQLANQALLAARRAAVRCVHDSGPIVIL
jgi:hypothetical protein